MSSPTNSSCNEWMTNQVIYNNTPNSCHNHANRKKTSLTELNLAKSGVKTPISSPPLDIVTAATVRKVNFALFLICTVSLLIWSCSRSSNKLLIPLQLG